MIHIEIEIHFECQCKLKHGKSFTVARAVDGRQADGVLADGLPVIRDMDPYIPCSYLRHV